MVINRLFDAAELRLGTKKTQQRVTIRREDVRRRRGS
jgi:type IV secretion system protein VirB9